MQIPRAKSGARNDNILTGSRRDIATLDEIFNLK